MTTTTTLTTNQCFDLPGRESVCNLFAAPKYCNSTTTFIGNDLFSQACKKSCNLCTTQPITTTTTTIICFDSQYNCAYWSNYCSLLTNYDPHPCRLTCKLCSTSPVSTIPTTLPTTTSNPCVDLKDNCMNWSKYCSLFTGQNPHPCRLTCKICSNSFASSSTTTVKTNLATTNNTLA